jgi:hypothetical protein
VLSMLKHAFLSPEERWKAREPRINDFTSECYYQKEINKINL